MKKSIYILLSVILLSVLFSCKKEPLLTYNIADNIYFQFDSSIDSLDVTFAFSSNSVEDLTVKIPVTVTGSPADHDRIFMAEADPGSTAIANTHYVLPKTFVIKAGQIRDSIPVKFIRSDDLQQHVVKLLLTLKTGGDFNTSLQGERDLTTYKILISDMLTPGSDWGSLTGYFGTFSVKKIKLMHEITGMPLDFMINFNPANIAATGPYYAVLMSRYLRDQKSAGHTIYEDDGVTEMLMGSTYR